MCIYISLLYQQNVVNESVEVLIVCCYFFNYFFLILLPSLP